jgi:hypothetical protein
MHRPHDVCAMHKNILFIKEGYAAEIIYLRAKPTRHCFYFGNGASHLEPEIELVPSEN